MNSSFFKACKGKWVAIGGGRWISEGTAKEVRLVTSQLIRLDGKIVTGGAEGVDHEALKVCLKAKLNHNRLKVFLPGSISKQYRHYLILEGKRKAQELLKTLSAIKTLDQEAIKENLKRFKNYRVAANYRNSLIVRTAQAAVVFSPKRSRGTGDALRKIDAKKIPYIILK